jgi:hypothetical protein
MNAFNRLVATILWLGLLVGLCLLAIMPFPVLEWLSSWITLFTKQLQTWQVDNGSNFLIGQAVVGVFAVLLFGSLAWLELSTLQRRGVRIQTAEGGTAEVDTVSISRRLAWHLDQVAEIITVMPIVKSRGRSVDIRLEIEAAPDVDIPMKTNEVVEVTRDVIEQDMGLRLGKLDVHLRCAPFEAV